YWIATWAMIRDHPWLGVGPGNFGRLYPRYMLPTAFETIQDPHNFVLEMWATSGVASAVALLMTLGIFFLLAVGTSGQGTTSGSETAEPIPHRPGIEFLVGGLAGLILGYLLRTADESGAERMTEDLIALGRAVVW